jgi:phosphoesterase RecJ-like protein
LRIKTLKSFLNKVNPKYGILFCHRNADPDAVFAAHVFSHILKKLNPKLKVDITAVAGASELSRLLMKKIHVKLVDHPELKKTDFVALIDTNTIRQLEDWGPAIEEAKLPLIIVDHHAPHPSMKNFQALKLINSNASSTCEIVYNLCKKVGYKIGRNDALALFFGIAYDSRHFQIASSNTFRIIAALVDKGVNVETALASLTGPMSRSERVARLKAAQRGKIHRIGNWLLCTSQVNSHEASAARGFLMLGADVAVVAGEKKGMIRISLRSTRDFFEKTGINLGRDIAIPLGEALSGMGGGHRTSAGVNGKGDISEALDKAVALFVNKIT